MARRHRPLRVTASAAVRVHLRWVLCRAMLVAPSRSHRPAKGSVGATAVTPSTKDPAIRRLRSRFILDEDGPVSGAEAGPR